MVFMVNGKPRPCWCNGSLQLWTTNSKKEVRDGTGHRCDICKPLCRAYPKRRAGCGVVHADACPCKDKHGGKRVGAGRPLQQFSDHEYHVQMQRRRLHRMLRKMQKMEDDFNKAKEKMHMRISEESHKLDNLLHFQDIHMEEAPPIRAPQCTGISLKVLGEASCSLRCLGFSVRLVPNVREVSEWMDFCSLRLCMFLRYAKLVSTRDLQTITGELQHVVKAYPNFESTQSGVPFRQFCKQSMYLYREGEKLKTGGVTEAAIMNIFLLVVIFRGWFNNMKLMHEFMERLGGLRADTFSQVDFVGVAHAMADKYRGDDCKRRSAAFNPGTYGAEGRELPEVQLFHRIVSLILPELQVLISQLVALCREGPAKATKETSLLVLGLLQSWLGPFVSLQCALDLEVLLPELFDGDHALDVGPGAVSVLLALFEGVGTESGMVRKRAAQIAARPLCHEMAHLIEHSKLPAAQRLRDVCDLAGLPRLRPKDVQYWSCEKRQLQDRLRQGIVRQGTGFVSKEDEYCGMFLEPWAQKLFRIDRRSFSKGKLT